MTSVVINGVEPSNGHKANTANVNSVAILVHESHPTIKALAMIIVFGWILTIITPIRNVLSLTPAYFMGRFYVWTIVTATLMESSLINMIVGLWMLFYSAAKVLPLWGIHEYIKVFFITTTAANVIALVCIVWHYALTYDETVLFRPYGGLGAAVSATTVLMWKLNPEARLQILTVKLPIRFRHTPLLLALTVGLQVLLGRALFSLFLVCSGMVVAWFYLRFYQKVDGVRGDSSTSFAFASQFPEFLQPTVEAINVRIFRVAKVMRLIPKEIMHVERNESLDSSDASRQRQRALRALNSQLGPSDQNA